LVFKYIFKLCLEWEVTGVASACTKISKFYLTLALTVSGSVWV